MVLLYTTDCQQSWGEIPRCCIVQFVRNFQNGRCFNLLCIVLQYSRFWVNAVYHQSQNWFQRCVVKASIVHFHTYMVPIKQHQKRCTQNTIASTKFSTQKSLFPGHLFMFCREIFNQQKQEKRLFGDNSKYFPKNQLAVII